MSAKRSNYSRRLLGPAKPVQDPTPTNRPGYQQVGPATLSRSKKAQARAFGANPNPNGWAYFTHSGGSQGAIDYYAPGRPAYGDPDAILRIQCYDGKVTAEQVGKLFAAAPRMLMRLRDTLLMIERSTDPDDAINSYGARSPAALLRDLVEELGGAA